MSYRDELDAAHSQIAILRARVTELQTRDNAAEHSDSLKRQIQNQTEENESLRRLLQNRTTEETASLHRLLKVKSDELDQEKARSESFTVVLRAQTEELESLRRALKGQAEELAQEKAKSESLTVVLRAQTEELESLRRNLRALQAPSPTQPRVSLSAATSSGLFCSRCHARGERVEILLSDGIQLCPRCHSK
jgi:DNA repair exonuclease SbcCD ATPase subunit